MSYDPIELERAEILMGVDGSGIHIEPRAGFRFTCDVQDIPVELLECAGFEGSKRDLYDLEGFAALDYSYDVPFVAGYTCIGGYKCGEHECPHMHTDAYYVGEPPAHSTGDECPLCEELWTEPGYVYDGEDARVLIYVKRPHRFRVTCGAEYSSLADLKQDAEARIRRVLDCGPGQPLVIQTEDPVYTYIVEGATEGTKKRILRMIGAKL